MGSINFSSTINMLHRHPMHDASSTQNLKLLKPLPPINQVSLLIKLNSLPPQKRKFTHLVLPAWSLPPIPKETSDESVGGYAAVAGL
jgi:hypothetical protein